MNRVDDVQSGVPVMPWPAYRIGGGPGSPTSCVPLEEPLSIEVNGHRVAVLMRLPGHERELAVGFCVSEGLITDFQAIEIVEHCGQGLRGPDARASDGEESRNRVRIRVRPNAVAKSASLEITRLIRSGCGAVGSTELGEIGLSPVTSDLSIPLHLLLRAKRLLRTGQEVHRRVGGVHGTAVFDAQGKLIVAHEDIGRHNAVDKVIGHCLMHAIPLDDKVLVSTGRASYEMLTKGIRLGIPIITTISACTSLAVQLAEEYDVTLIGYLRGKRMTIYTHPERVVASSSSRDDRPVT